MLEVDVDERVCVEEVGWFYARRGSKFSLATAGVNRRPQSLLIPKLVRE